MTKHILIAKYEGKTFQEQVTIAESQGWQALPQTFSQWRTGGFSILMFKIESNDPYRAEATS